MSDPTSYQSLDREIMDSLQSIAASIFARHGVDFAAVRRAGGWTNAVWLADGLVLRLSTTQGSESLLCEARLATFFPPAVGYPTILETGTTGGIRMGTCDETAGQELGRSLGRLALGGAGHCATRLVGTSPGRSRCACGRCCRDCAGPGSTLPTPKRPKQALPD